ncbi:MAG: hypothetical protein HC815_30840 [Richelia sp. RM1_1_1]|nr:hypothetical protein [Richelia sp. RM1_1_1]
MDFNKLGNELNSKPQQIKTACKELFGNVPTMFTPEQAAQVKEYLASQDNQPALPETKSIAVSDTQKPATQQPGQAEEIDINNLGEAEIQRILKAQSLQGESLAELVAGLKVEAFLNRLKQSDAQLVNAVINNSLQNTIQLKHLANQVKQLNGSSEPELIDVSHTIQQHKQALLPEEDLVAKYLLPAEQEDDWTI